MKHFRKWSLALHQLEMAINLTVVRNRHIFCDKLINKNIPYILPEGDNLCLGAFADAIKGQSKSFLAAGDVAVDNGLIEKCLCGSEGYGDGDF
jgi:hypothetical protein